MEQKYYTQIKSYGTVEPGKRADLLIVDKNPLDNIDNIKSFYLVIKGGKIFKKEINK